MHPDHLLRNLSGPDHRFEGKPSMRSFVKQGFGSAQLAGLACLTVTAGVAHAANYIGWVLDDQPGTTAPYTPNPSYSFNSAHGSITIYHQGVGTYSIYFSNLVG